MSKFKDMVSRDIDNVFLNIEENGEEHKIDGKKIICVVDDDTLRKRQGGAEYAVGQNYMFIFAKCDDLPNRKGYGAELAIDGIPYIVESWDENEGMASITLFIANNS